MHMGVSQRKTQACLTQLITLHALKCKSACVEMYTNETRILAWAEKFSLLIFFFFYQFLTWTAKDLIYETLQQVLYAIHYLHLVPITFINQKANAFWV